MKLFNKYKNKDFTYMINYINNCINDPSLAISPENLKMELLGDSQNTFAEFIDALVNTNENGLDPTHPNVNLLFNNNGQMLPLRNIEIPIRASYAEKAWLYYILLDPKADLFLNKEQKFSLLNKLETAINYPISSTYIDFKELSHTNNLQLTQSMIVSFRLIIQAIKEKKFLTLTNTTFSGEIYKIQKLIPYKLEYSKHFDSFALSAYPLKAKRPVKINLANISDVIVGELVENYEDFISMFESMLLKTREKDPIIIEILNQNEAFDRCSYKFAAFDRVSYETAENNLIMKIYYYRFQREEIIRNILFLGRFVKVISPQPIVDEIISILKHTYENYNDPSL